MNRTKRITVYQHTHAQTLVDVEREITIEVPFWLETQNISEEQLQKLIEDAIESGLVSESQADWHSGGDHSLVDEQDITSEVVDVVSDDTNQIGTKQISFGSNKHA